MLLVKVMGSVMNKVELLAPAGNYDALMGAINAGADAVYLGGEKYSARAYADNFSREEICDGIHFAHVFGKRIYLTINTLVKENELDDIYTFLLPYYESGLDGVIVQDLGALRFIKKHFPGLALHASTQMSLTGSLGTKLIKEEGVSRIVPARELSLEEIQEIKQTSGIEIEAFIHGAMCYCYSGQCLFSSILGGRSGNRGRCAQPCRLPYRVDGGREQYPLSMRDMCTIELIPQLIDAGIDSFKIEGRMKKPAYAAGVTAIYRKYIDLYYEDCDNYHVDKADMDRLNALYIRSEIGDGYYHRHNGQDMITLNSPAYSETDESLLRTIEQEYIEREPGVNARAEIILEAGKPAELLLKAEDRSIRAIGDIVQLAQKQPLSDEKIIKQIKKSGNSTIVIDEVKVSCKGQIFMPIGALNDLRRRAILKMEEELIRQNGLLFEERKTVLKDTEQSSDGGIHSASSTVNLSLHVAVRTKEQLIAALEQKPTRIYIDYSLLIINGVQKIQELLYSENSVKKEFPALYVAAPYIVRKNEFGYLAEIRHAVEAGLFSGVLIRNLESFGYFKEYLDKDKLVLDSGMYLWNRESIRFFEGETAEFYLPIECNRNELSKLQKICMDDNACCSAILYGRLPMMITANCLQKTTGSCTKQLGLTSLKDRYGKIFPVFYDCLCCYNIVYNSVPLSLHKFLQENMHLLHAGRLDFTTENGRETKEVIRYFKRITDCYEEPPYQEYTTGHYKRGVE